MDPGPVGSDPLLVGKLPLHAGLGLPLVIDLTEQVDLDILPAVELLNGGGQHRLAVGGDGEFTRQLRQQVGFLLGIAQCFWLAPLAYHQVAGEAGHE